jgi:hypothetical protein
MLHFPNGDLFSTGVITCDIQPLNQSQSDNNRIILSVEVGGARTNAVVDTGGIYCILHPAAAEQIQFDPSESIGDRSVNVRGVKYSGTLYRAVLEIHAREGADLQQDVTVFVPETSAEDWGEMPTFLGLTGCLEFLRFAIDPQSRQFYFASA